MNQPGDIVRKAREVCCLTQSDFAKLLGRTQGEISKYERNIVDPPGSLIIHMVNIINGREEQFAPSAEDIIVKLRDGFNSPKYAMARSQIMGIILNEEKKNSWKRLEVSPNVEL